MAEFWRSLKQVIRDAARLVKANPLLLTLPGAVWFRACLTPEERERYIRRVLDRECKETPESFNPPVEN